MSAIEGIGNLAGPAPTDERRELRRLAGELEGVFLSQLFSAMRASVPEGGVIDQSSGEELFTSLFHESLATEAAGHMKRGIGEAIYKQLSRRLPPEGEPPTARAE